MIKVLEGKGIHLGNGCLSSNTSLGSEPELPSLFFCSLGKIKEGEKALCRGGTGTVTGLSPWSMSWSVSSQCREQTEFLTSLEG